MSCLPASGSGVWTSRAPDPYSQAKDMEKLRAFVVEDNPIIRANLIEALEDLANVEVVGFEAGEASALKWLQEKPGACDVALIDIFLESGSGLGVLRGLQKMGEAGGRVPPRVVVSNYAHAHLRHVCEGLGASAVFDKSLGLDELLEWLMAQAESIKSQQDPLKDLVPRMKK